MKILRIRVKGLPLYKKTFDVSFCAVQRVQSNHMDSVFNDDSLIRCRRSTDRRLVLRKKTLQGDCPKLNKNKNKIRLKDDIYGNPTLQGGGKTRLKDDI